MITRWTIMAGVSSIIDDAGLTLEERHQNVRRDCNQLRSSLGLLRQAQADAPQATIASGVKLKLRKNIDMVKVAIGSCQVGA